MIIVFCVVSFSGMCDIFYEMTEEIAGCDKGISTKEERKNNTSVVSSSDL
jgi:hypothetical protein